MFLASSHFFSPAAYLCLALTFASRPACALILFGGDNDANQTGPPSTSPAYQVPFGHAGGVSSGAGTNVQGTCVYLGNNFFLTAKHVGLPTYVRVGGLDYQVDTAWGSRPLGTADAHVFRVHNAPPLAIPQLYTGTNDTTKLAVITGWGIGRDPSAPPPSTNVPWGQGDTSALRWGTNQILGSGNLSTLPGETYQALIWYLGSESGNDEASLTAGDSGSPVWVKSSGVWKLAGICTGVKHPYTSVFQPEANADANNHYNACVRLSVYQTELAAALAVRTLTITSAMPQGGNVSPAGASLWPLNYPVALTATAQPGWRFTGWTGTGATFANIALPSTTVTLSDHLSVSANFENLAADTNGDGIGNLIAYAFALEGFNSAAQGLPRTLVEPGPDSTPRLTLTYRIRTGDTALSHSVESSPDLSVWTEAGTQVETVSVVEVSPGVEERTVRMTTPVGVLPQFLRVKVDYAE